MNKQRYGLARKGHGNTVIVHKNNTIAESW